VDDESAACGCDDGLATLGLGGCELPAVEFFECNSFIFCFCFANTTSLAEAFLCVILSEAERRRRENIHVCPLHTEPLLLRGCALAARCLHHFVHAVSKSYEPSREERTVTYHENRRGCGQISGEETCCLTVLRSGDDFVHRTENTGQENKIKARVMTYMRWWDSVEKTLGYP
jgi:hypothetical protein